MCNNKNNDDSGLKLTRIKRKITRKNNKAHANASRQFVRGKKPQAAAVYIMTVKKI